MKKLASLLLSIALLLGLLAGCGESGSDQSDPGDTETGEPTTSSSTPADDDTGDSGDGGAQVSGEIELEPKKIAVANFSTDSYALLIQQYYRDYLGPAFNVEFMFSEGVESAEGMMDFLESAYAAGCDGVINYSQDSVDQVVEKANDLGMYIVTHTTTPGENPELPYNLGYVGADASTSGEDFAILVRDLVDDGVIHNFIVLSGGAGLGRANDLATTVSCLETIQDIYDLTFDEDIEELAAVRAETDCDNDGDIKVTIYPGYANTDTYVPGLSSLLQTGDYDIIICNSTAFAQAATVIDEVERAFDLNIKIVAKAQVSDTISNSFKTLDSFGDTFLHSAQLTPSISTAGSMFAILYNGISGYAENVRKDGEAIFYDNPKWLCFGPEDYEQIERLNISDDTWEMTVEDYQELLCIYNPDADADSIYDYLVSTGDLELVLQRRGLR